VIPHVVWIYFEMIAESWYAHRLLRFSYRMASNRDSHGLTGKQLFDVLDVPQGSISIVKANISRAENVVDRCNPRAQVLQRRGLADLQLTGRTFRAANQVECPENHVDVRRSRLD
jgi:hypothetical protein